MQPEKCRRRTARWRFHKAAYLARNFIWNARSCAMTIFKSQYLALLVLTASLFAQQPPADAPSNSVPTIKVEAREVLVDSVVTDKKGNYLRDLKAKDFKVWEDNKEQNITSFSFEEEGNPSGPTKPHYMVL